MNRAATPAIPTVAPTTTAPGTAPPAPAAAFTARWRIDADEPVFAGHFPGAPILPGVLTLALVRATLAQATGRDWALRRLQRHKLLLPIRPGAEVAVACRMRGLDDGGLTLDCQLTLADGALAATARLTLEPR